MVRLVDVVSAFGQRGYPLGIETEIHLRVEDRLLPKNSGCFVISVANGRGNVRHGGKGRLKLDVRGLAPLFTGHLPPAMLVCLGLLEGSESDLKNAAAVFAGSAPWMWDAF